MTAAATRARLLALAALVALSGCGEEPTVTALFELPRAGAPPPEFYALPFPTDLRRRTDGTIDLDDHVRPNDLIDLYLDVISARVTGFGTNAALFVRFDGELDPGSLPADAAASLADGAAVQLVDVDPDSPERGQRTPLLFRFSPYEGESIGPDWLGCLPYPGHPLRPDTTYALLVTDRLRAADGGGVGRSPDFDALLGDGGDATVAAARAVHAPLLDYLDEPGGEERADLVAAAVFTTQDPVALIGGARARIHRDVAAPVARDLAAGAVTPDFAVYVGTFDGPNFQTGLPPYDQPEDGGEILVDDAGEPIVQRTEALRFAISIPTGTMPQTGWPVVIYAHGTGGDYASFIGDGTAARMGREGLAVISMDQPMHGPRGDGSDPTEQLVFNYRNPTATLDVIRQGAIDDFQLLRLIDGLVLPASLTGGEQATLDGDRISFMGHSQGGITGAPFVAWEPRVRGAVLSGAGGLLYQTMLHKEGVPELVAAFIRDYPLDQFNNLLALVQMFGESADPANYGPLLLAPPAGGTAKDIYQSEGFVDSYTPAITIEALGVAIGAAPVEPVLTPVAGFALRSLAPLTAPVTGNAGDRTAVFVQYQAAAGDDGHFVVFDVAAARRQHAAFLGTLARDGRATLVP